MHLKSGHFSEDTAFFRSGDFALQPAENIFLDVAVFVIGDAAALYFLLGKEWMPQQKLAAFGGFAVMRVFGWVYSALYLKRNRTLVRSGFRYDT